MQGSSPILAVLENGTIVEGFDVPHPFELPYNIIDLTLLQYARQGIMPKDSTFFEEAYALCRDSDPNVSRIAEKLYEQMLLQNQQKMSPHAGFNILYFFQGVIRVWFAPWHETTLQATSYPYPCDRIHGINWPNQSAVNHHMANRFVELVKSESIPTGSDFDVGYAAKIITLVFDGDGIFIGSSHSIEQADDEFDYWLSGFNAEPS